MSHVLTGLDVLLRDDWAPLARRRIGLLTNQTGVARDLRDNVALLAASGRTRLRAIFAPEHGLLGTAQAGAAVTDSVERRTGTPVYSLYGARRAPTPEQLADLDALVFDVQDVGARYYTYLDTMRLAMIAVAAAGRTFVVLDRPNPLGGDVVEGLPPFDERLRSSVACAPLPIRYGLTLGEAAVWIARAESLDLDLHVVRMAGWSRAMAFEDTGLAWIPPSPNMPAADTARVYPGTCLLEGTNASEGRGTTRPFEVFGAPWVDGHALAASLNARRLPGVVFRATSFTPAFSKHAGAVCEGAQAHVFDTRAFSPVRTGIEVVAALLHGHSDFAFLGEGGRRPFDALLGTDAVRLALEAGTPAEGICAEWAEREAAYSADSRGCWLYA
jgi:uncharacterized protein YbbC (DUF1343 family)